MTTLPTDSNARKEVPLFSGCLAYFSAALAGVARHSKRGNDKHNPGQPLHWSRGKSSDHADCVVRHLLDIGDMLAAHERGPEVINMEALLQEADALVWRAAALSQELYEKFGGAPMSAASRGVDYIPDQVCLATGWAEKGDTVKLGDKVTVGCSVTEEKGSELYEAMITPDKGASAAEWMKQGRSFPTGVRPIGAEWRPMTDPATGTQWTFWWDGVAKTWVFDWCSDIGPVTLDRTAEGPGTLGWNGIRSSLVVG